MTKVELFSYALSYDELVKTWIDANEKFGHALVIYEPRAHQQYFRDMNLPYTEEDMYLAELLILEFPSLDDCKSILKYFDPWRGPHVQLWSLGKLIGDNIDFVSLIEDQTN